MTATERLRQLLDERGVECGWSDEYNDQTWWSDSDRIYFAKDEAARKTLIVLNLTPEQAVEATLGRGTCHDVAIEGEWFECSECGTVKQLIHPNYCPSCGRRVEP